MTDVFIGQIMMTGFGYAQKNFSQCNGQLMPITQFQALFALLGTYYGGDGIRTFALPDLRSRTPAGGGFPSTDPAWQPAPYALGEVSGSENVTLLASQLPLHTHGATVTSSPGTDTPPASPLTLSATSVSTATLYGPTTALMPLGGGPLTPNGGSQPHPNLQPYETINFNIALYGIFPSRG